MVHEGREQKVTQIMWTRVLRRKVVSIIHQSTPVDVNVDSGLPTRTKIVNLFEKVFTIDF